MTEEANATSTRNIVIISLAVAAAEALGLGVAALISGSVALGAQTADSTADVAVEVFLLIGVLSSARPANDSHPLGYGRERFFWSLLAALGIFVGGGGISLEEAVESALHPAAVDHYLLAYLVLAATIAMDAFALVVTLRPLRKRATMRGISLLRLHAVERTIADTAVALRERWPSIQYLYLTPVPSPRPRRIPRSRARSVVGKTSKQA
jgi:divalent metal cation (Fe/Co/Zn/Cd) transporter